jgi:23S rRNA pseudouridine2604 synthase
MCEYFGYEVRKLERVRIMNVSLTGIPLGEWRDLTDKELDGVFSMIQKSSSETEKSKPKTKPQSTKPKKNTSGFKPMTKSSGSRPSLFGKGKPKSTGGRGKKR